MNEAAVRSEARVAGDPRRRMIALALAVLLLVVAFQAARLGIADTFLWAARAAIEQGDRVSNPDGPAQAARFVTLGLRVAPQHPAALEEMALLELRQMRSSTEAKTAVGLTKSAYAHLRLALVQSPASALNWARVAATKLYLAEDDDESISALRWSLTLGPRDRGVPELASHVGLALWSRLDHDLRSGVVQALRVSAARDPQVAFSVARSYGRFDLVCDISALKALAETACTRAGASR